MITRKRVDDEEDVKARPGKKGYTGPALEAGLVGTQRCVSSRSSHLQVTPLSVPENWKLRSLDIKDAFLEEDGFDREAYLRAPLGQGPTEVGSRLNGGGVRKTLKCYLLQEQDSLTLVGLKFRASASDPCLYFVFRPNGGGRGSPDHPH